MRWLDGITDLMDMGLGGNAGVLAVQLRTAARTVLAAGRHRRVRVPHHLVYPPAGA